jgi:hypothetical protein
METTFSIGGIAIRVRVSDARLDAPPDQATSRFVVASRTPDIDVAVSVLENYTPAAGKLLFDSGGMWHMYAEGDAYRIEFRSATTGEVPYKIAFVSRDATHVDVRMRLVPQGPAPAFQYPLDELVVNAYLARNGGLEIHSCGVIDAGGDGILFAGNSGAGKTTTARLWQPYATEIISDDRIILRRENGDWWMYGTPWHGDAEICSASRAPLRRIFLLEQSTTNEMKPLSQSQAVARLVSCTFPPFHDATALGGVVSALAKLTAEVPVARLAFAKDERVVAFVRSMNEVAA